MTHTGRCEYAKGDLCRCECQGEQHGIKSKEENKETIFNDACPECEAFDPHSYASGCKDMFDNIPLRCEEKQSNPQINLSKWFIKEEYQQ